MYRNDDELFRSKELKSKITALTKRYEKNNWRIVDL